jgi:hypothetical protein
MSITPEALKAALHKLALEYRGKPNRTVRAADVRAGLSTLTYYAGDDFYETLAKLLADQGPAPDRTSPWTERTERNAARLGVDPRQFGQLGETPV